MTEPKKRGRPSHRPSRTSRLRVAQGAAGGMRFSDIAEALGVTEPTLRKHYRDELTTGARKERLAVVQAMVRAAKKGNVSAAKYLAERPPEEFDYPTRTAPKLTTPLPPIARAEPIGKKAAANEAAKTAAEGTDWELLLDPSAPVQ